jgi:hypothetical protein
MSGDVPVLLILASSGWSPMNPDAIEAYERGIRDLTIERLQSDHDLGQRSNPGPLHSAIGAFMNRLDAAIDAN